MSVFSQSLSALPYFLRPMKFLPSFYFAFVFKQYVFCFQVQCQYNLILWNPSNTTNHFAALMTPNCCKWTNVMVRMPSDQVEVRYSPDTVYQMNKFHNNTTMFCIIFSPRGTTTQGYEKYFIPKFTSVVFHRQFDREKIQLVYANIW